ncbi:MAG: hypothetical protein WDN04_27535 [Rhodospirillales bacterium]
MAGPAMMMAALSPFVASWFQIRSQGRGAGYSGRVVVFASTSRVSRQVGARERAELLVLCLMRIALVLFAAYVGALVVRNVTHALCSLAGQTPPAWTRGGA